MELEGIILFLLTKEYIPNESCHIPPPTLTSRGISTNPLTLELLVCPLVLPVALMLACISVAMY